MLPVPCAGTAKAEPKAQTRAHLVFISLRTSSCIYFFPVQKMCWIWRAPWDTLLKSDLSAYDTPPPPRGKPTAAVDLVQPREAAKLPSRFSDDGAGGQSCLRSLPSQGRPTGGASPLSQQFAFEHLLKKGLLHASWTLDGKEPVSLLQGERQAQGVFGTRLLRESQPPLALHSAHRDTKPGSGREVLGSTGPHAHTKENRGLLRNGEGAVQEGARLAVLILTTDVGQSQTAVGEQPSAVAVFPLRRGKPLYFRHAVPRRGGNASGGRKGGRPVGPLDAHPKGPSQGNAAQEASGKGNPPPG